ncbi:MULTISPECIES: shikimate kinase [Variovorax]|jgi:shikimate kinase|uniref:shikimate kinase n=1 Tax=Variovorax TaxID=34072 RepID=UPI00086D5EA1|nr:MULTISPECIES: shikimate kinase [Variovorax]MBN8754523.1 shikimate kinase [Variovorax sp.]ODU17565.1 MAG: shikimate kinase [Variovorax sp. SCN 67-85]ODV24250.1 MAG: shikimate kinase [Variovorax sp. SCN 67-20]OJZ04126.1 MAG: shikimate kinase [Variovorax sp. 67-131]UKI09997.1 shikimate kinase [Variovorax paradoxus]
MQQARAVPVVQLVGPGGAGKTTVGSELARQLGWQFVDLDREFMSREGDISGYMAVHGYAGYARRNLALHAELRGAFTAPTVYVLSSGFMTYPADVDASYAGIRAAVERDTLTLLLLPSFELETCVQAIVRRQLSRPYLPGNAASEEARIRQRFPVFMALRCARFLNDGAPEEAAAHMARFVRERVDN